MYIAGLQKTSLIDFPGKISAVLFFWGCNFRCSYCQNPELVKRELKPPKISENEIFKFLRKRKNLLDGVVISGGEPTLFLDLPCFLRKIKDLGYLIKLDTNGTSPKMLKKIIKEKLVDFLAMDIKGPFEKYKKITNTEVDLKKIKESIKAIINSDLAYEFRSTILPSLHSEEDIQKMAKAIEGAEKYFLQTFVPQVKLLDTSFKDKKPFSREEMEKFKQKCQKFVKCCEIR